MVLPPHGGGGPGSSDDDETSASGMSAALAAPLAVGGCRETTESWANAGPASSTARVRQQTTRCMRGLAARKPPEA
jgi:hypothetical protein